MGLVRHGRLAALAREHARARGPTAPSDSPRPGLPNVTDSNQSSCLEPGSVVPGAWNATRGRRFTTSASPRSTNESKLATWLRTRPWRDSGTGPSRSDALGGRGSRPIGAAGRTLLYPGWEEWTRRGGVKTRCGAAARGIEHRQSLPGARRRRSRGGAARTTRRELRRACRPRRARASAHPDARGRARGRCAEAAPRASRRPLFCAVGGGDTHPRGRAARRGRSVSSTHDF